MPPKGIGKAVNKRCPECKRQIPVASRLCSCGYQFFEERRKSTTSNASEHDDGSAHAVSTEDAAANKSIASTAVEGKRRSERVKREKPNFYDATEYDNKMRKRRREKRQLEAQLTQKIKKERKFKNISDYDEDDDVIPLKVRKKKKKRDKEKIKLEEEIEEDVMAGIGPEKEAQFGIVLADINLKLGLNNPMFF